MPKIKVSDINIYYEIHGDGYPLVMIMGFTGTANFWSPFLIDGVSKFFKLIIFDNRGAGRTDKPDYDYTIPMMANDTVGLMSALNVERAHILGLSMGGMIAQELVLNHPEKVDRLILAGTHCGGSRSIFPPVEITDFLAGKTTKSPEEWIEKEMPLLYSEEFIKNNPEYIEKKKKGYLETPLPDKSRERNILAAGRFNAGRRLKKISASTLVLHGKQDLLIPYKNAETLATNIPGARLELFDNLGHDIFSPEPERVNKIIIDFLK
ncbi:MAG: alpha/beta fold hydrolase [Promethearchaeota archaeon]